MPLYTIRGLQLHGVPPRNPMLSGQYMDSHSPPSSSQASEVYGDDEEDEDEDDLDCMGHDSDAGSGSVRSVSSPPMMGFYVDGRRQAGLTSEEYAEYLEGGILPQDLITPAVGSSSDSGSGSRHSSAFVLPELGLADSDLSDPQDFLGAVESDNESHGGDESRSGSDGELSNVNSIDIEDDELGGHSYCDEVPRPPQLPGVCEERLQDVWPLGDASFSIFLCPITHDIMRDPVVGADGYTYERSAIARWFETSCKSPVTGQTLPHTELVPNHSVRTLLKMMIDMTEPPERPAEEVKDKDSQAVGEASASSAAGLVVQSGDSSGMAEAVAAGDQKQLPSSAYMASSGCEGASCDSSAAGTSLSPAAATTAGSPEAAAAASAGGKRSSGGAATPTTPVLL